MSNDDVKSLREMIRTLERKLGAMGKDDAACCGITIAQCHAIVEIGRAEPISLNKLAEVLNLDKSTVSRTIDGLVNRNIVERMTDPEDRRAIAIQVTPGGKGILDGIEKRMNGYYKHVYAAIPPEKREQVLDSLALLLNVLDENACC